MMMSGGFFAADCAAPGIAHAKNAAAIRNAAAP
jgi:hypothetical protein